MSFSSPFALAQSFPLFIQLLGPSYPHTALIHPGQVCGTLEKMKAERRSSDRKYVERCLNKLPPPRSGMKNGYFCRTPEHLFPLKFTRTPVRRPGATGSLFLGCGEFSENSVPLWSGGTVGGPASQSPCTGCLWEEFSSQSFSWTALG